MNIICPDCQHSRFRIIGLVGGGYGFNHNAYLQCLNCKTVIIGYLPPDLYNKWGGTRTTNGEYMILEGKESK